MGLFGDFGNLLQSVAPIAVGAGIGSVVPGLGTALGAQLGAGVSSALGTAESVRDQNAAEVAAAREQMGFQMMMSNTSVQRMRADMMSAGINPLMAAGAGESTPAGAMPSITAVPSVMSSLVTSGRDALSLLQNLSESESRIQKNNADAGLAVTTQAKESADAYIESIKKTLLQKIVGGIKSTALSMKNANLTGLFSDIP